MTVIGLGVESVRNLTFQVRLPDFVLLTFKIYNLTDTGEELRLLVCGYIRPEAGFHSLQALIERIHEDARVSRAVLAESQYAALKSDPFLSPLAT